MKCLLILLFAFIVTSISAQTSEPPAKTFDKDGLKFNYPADWNVTDKSSEDSQRVLLSKENTTVLISILSPRLFIRSPKQFRDIQASAFKTYISAISKSLSSPRGKPEQEYLCLDFNGRKITGTKFTGFYNNEPGKGEAYPLVLGDRFLALAYIRTDKEAEKTDVVWQELIKSISLEGSNKDSAGSFAESEIVDEGVLNSRAINLAKPWYPKALRDAGASGEVVVKVEINEKGKVVSAKAISGNKLLYYDSEAAAKKSKFTPTMVCGTPVKVTGTIIYNFYY
jgi:TonB family protein